MAHIHNLLASWFWKYAFNTICRYLLPWLCVYWLMPGCYLFDECWLKRTWKPRCVHNTENKTAENITLNNFSLICEMKSMVNRSVKGLQEHFSNIMPLMTWIEEGKRKRQTKGCKSAERSFLPDGQLYSFFPSCLSLLLLRHNEAPLCCINRQLKWIN